MVLKKNLNLDFITNGVLSLTAIDHDDITP